MTLFHDPGFAAPLGKHIMPISKFALVAAEISREFPDIRIASPRPVTPGALLRVHTPHYIDAVQTGDPRELAESQKFPWSPELFRSVLMTNGGLLAAADLALTDGSSGALASGFHHACADHGEGFCTFNGLVIALESLRASGRIQTAAVLDLDLHYGNGTALLAASRPWLRALSIYGNDYWDNKPFRDVRHRHHDDGPNHISVPLVPTGGPDRDLLLTTLETHLSWLLNPEKPDILLYQAGADPSAKDTLGSLKLSDAGLRERDRRVFAAAAAARIPVVVTLGGGYPTEVEDIVRIHTNTVLAARASRV